MLRSLKVEDPPRPVAVLLGKRLALRKYLPPGLTPIRRVQILGGTKRGSLVFHNLLGSRFDFGATDRDGLYLSVEF